MENDLNILLRLLVSVVLCGILGWERAANRKQAGLRTHILVGVGATLFVALAEAMVTYFSEQMVYSTAVPTGDPAAAVLQGEEGDHLRLQFDPIRVLEAVVAGISFLGAGTIFVSKAGGERVQGLTTAAAIWTTAGVGLAVGVERYALAAGATALIFCVLSVLGRLERRGALPGVEATPAASGDFGPE